LFQNLIDNALSFNDKEQGKVVIGVKDKKDYWEFYIQENSKGIDEIYFDKTLKTFKKFENNLKSLGIGLSLVKKP
jgi:light-regulated signal transduction histidine kinase (bacteriophytochrome)